MIRRMTLLAIGALAVCALAVPAQAAAADDECELIPRTQCFGLESLEASLSDTRAGAHPDLTFIVGVKLDPESEPNVFGLKDAYAPTRNVRVELPPGLIGDPNVLGTSQQCTVQELLTYNEPGGGCPNGSQIGISNIFAYELENTFLEPIYMMRPPGGDVAARVGIIAGIFPVFVDFKLRSDEDYGLTAEINDASTEAKLIRLETTTWGVPADPSHNTERCTAQEAFLGCKSSPPRPPGATPLPFLTNPTRCGTPLSMGVGVSSWAESPDEFDTKFASFPEIVNCNSLPFGPSLTVDPTSHRAASPSGADVTIRLPASEGVNVLEPSHMRSITVTLPEGFVFNPSAGDGLATCSVEQVNFEKRIPAECPNASKLADTEFDIPVLERSLKGAVYLREPEPGNPFRIWIVADDLGLNVKLPGQLEVDKSTGQITAVTTDVPQAPVREARLEFKSGFRAPLITPSSCGEYRTNYQFTPWSGGPAVTRSTPVRIDEGCETGGFKPKLSAGTVSPVAGTHSPFLFTLKREDGEQNPLSLDITLPKGLAATFAGIPRCQGVQAESGSCAAASRIGSVTAAVGAGPAPLWVPQPDKRPTAVYLGGPYRGAPLSVIAVVPAQAGPFDFGDEVVRSAVFVDPLTAQATVRSDPFPQIIEGIPLGLRTIHVAVDRPGFTLNPTGCEPKTVAAVVTSNRGAKANPSSPFEAANCAKLGFKPRVSVQLRGGTKRGGHPSLRAIVRPRPGDANFASVVTRLPRSAFLDQSHIRTVCTRVQYAAKACPEGSIYGHVRAFSPLLDEPLEGPVYLRSSSHPLPDLVFSLRGLVEIETVGRVDSVNGGIRASFEQIPDAPLTKVVLTMQGGKKGLIENSTNLCKGTHKFDARLSAQNGKQLRILSPMKADCGRKKG